MINNILKIYNINDATKVSIIVINWLKKA